MWWPALVACAERGGSNEAELRRKMALGHTVLWPVVGGCLALDRAEDDALVVWLGVGDGKALRTAERGVVGFARDIGCDRLRIEGRKGWKRLLTHWTIVDEDSETVTLELGVSR